MDTNDQKQLSDLPIGEIHASPARVLLQTQHTSTHVRVCAGVLLDCVQCSAVCNLIWCTSRVNQCVGRYCRYCSQVIHLSDSCFVLHKLCKVGCIQFTQGFVFGEIKIPTEEGGGYLRVLIFGWVPWSTAITWYHNRNNLVLLEISRTAPH
jgi:hypothetical protein